MAGNGVLLKHAESCTGSGLLLKQIYEEAGLPKGLFTVLLIDHDQSDDVIAHDKVRGVTLTGSEGAGSDRDTQMQSAPVESAPVVLREESTPVVLREVSRSSSTIAMDQSKRDLRELVVKKRKISVCGRKASPLHLKRQSFFLSVAAHPTTITLPFHLAQPGVIVLASPVFFKE